ADGTLQFTVTALKQPMPPPHDTPHSGRACQERQAPQPPSFEPHRLYLEIHRRCPWGDRTIANVRPDFQPVVAWAEPDDGHDPVRGFGPLTVVQPVGEVD